MPRIKHLTIRTSSRSFASKEDLKRRKPKPKPPIKRQRTKKKKEKRQQLIFNENHTAPPYPVETSVNPVHATGPFVYRKRRRTRPFQLIHLLPSPLPRTLNLAFREQTILFPPGGTRQIREYEKELPPPVLLFLHLLLLSHTVDGNKSLISAAFFPFRVLRGEKRRGGERRGVRAYSGERFTQPAGIMPLFQSKIRGEGMEVENGNRGRMVLAKFNFASRHFYFSLISRALRIFFATNSRWKGTLFFLEGCFCSIVLLLRLLRYYLSAIFNGNNE